MLTGQTAIAIYNAELLNSLQRAYMELEVAYGATLEGWVRALDMRDGETEGQRRPQTQARGQEPRSVPRPPVPGRRLQAIPHEQRRGQSTFVGLDQAINLVQSFRVTRRRACFSSSGPTSWPSI